ncbi:MAG: fluoride efflux transporter CrcB [Bacillota bacterium]
MWSKFFALGLGGFIGSNLRYWISNWVMDHLGQYLPYGTLFVNGLGCFILGFITVYGNEVVEISPVFRVFIGPGLLGALTTFATFSLETGNLIRESNYLSAVLNIALNVGIGLCAVELGFLAAKALAVTAHEAA